MMKNNLSLLTLAAAMAESTSGMFASDRPNNPLKPSDISGEIHIVVPKGCKEYFFNYDGQWSTEKMRYADLAFKCVALTEKSALKKYRTFCQLRDAAQTS